MVSGLVTSPCDQDRIFSGLARRILIASKSITGLPVSIFGLIGIIRLIGSVPRNDATESRSARSSIPRDASPRRLWKPSPSLSVSFVSPWLSFLVLRLDQFHVEAEALQLANEHVERLRQARRVRRVALDDRL